MPNLNGPESLPQLEYNKDPLPIIVSVFKPDSDDPIRSEKVDYGNFEHRKWLGRITLWALKNKYIVETMNDPGV